MTNQLSRRNEHTDIFDANRHFHLTSGGLSIFNNPSFADCEEYLGKLKTLNHIVQFAIGDLLNYVEDAYGDYSQMVDVLDYTLGSLANFKSVSKEFSPERRRERVPFSYYAALQSLEPAQQDELLDKVEAGEITALSHLRNRAKIIKEHSKRPKAGCEHDYMTVCKYCGKIAFE